MKEIELGSNLTGMIFFLTIVVACTLIVIDVPPSHPSCPKFTNGVTQDTAP